MNALVRVLVTAITAVALGAVLGGCEPEDSGGDGARSSLSPTELRKADCHDWRAAPAGERRAAVRGFATYFGQNLPQGSPPQTLPNGEAYELLERACSHHQAKDFFLWGVYMQAAGFGDYRRAYAAGLRRLERAGR